MEILQKILNIELPYDPVIPLLCIYSKEMKAGSRKDTCTLMFITLYTVTHTNQATIKYHSHLLEWLLSKRQEITSVGENVEKREP